MSDTPKINNEEKHIIREREDGKRDPTPEEIAQHKARESIATEVHVTLFKDGNMQMNGPWHDRLLFEGVLGLATDAMRDQFHKMQAQAAQRVQPVRLGPRDLERLKRGGHA